MKRLCPQCRKTVDFAAPTCENCQMRFFDTPDRPKDLFDLCIPIAGAVLIAAIGAFVAIVLHPWS
jgi:hypothetical protein